MRRLVIIAALLLLPASAHAVYSLPAERSIDWTNAGVPGDIPLRSTICSTVSATWGDGVADARTAINNALAACPADQVVSIPAGTYRVTNTLTIPTHVVMRGAGMSSTVILFDPAANITTGVSIAGNSAMINQHSVTALHTKGSTTLTLDSVSGLSVGDFIVIDGDQDSTFSDITNVGVGTCTWCYISGDANTRNIGEIKVITAIDGLNVGISPELYFTYQTAQTPHIHEITSMKQYVGIEDLTLQGGMTYKVQYFISGTATAYSWIRNVKVYNFRQKAYDAYYTFRNTMRSNWIDLAECNQGNYGYGFGFLKAATNNLLEDNIFTNIHDPIVIETGLGAGNVIAYNFVHNMRYDNGTCGAGYCYTGIWPTGNCGWTPGGIITHGAHPIFTLEEGNDSATLGSDGYWGSSAATVIFRNRAHGVHKDPRIANTWNYSNNVAIRLEANQEMFSVIGNVLGTDGVSTDYEIATASGDSGCLTKKTIYTLGYLGQGGVGACRATGYDAEVKDTLLRHANYDYVNDAQVWNGADDHTLPNSLYLASKPSWYGNAVWPPVDPSGPTVNKIPARLRYEGVAYPYDGGESPTWHLITYMPNNDGALTCDAYSVVDGGSATCTIAPGHKMAVISISGCGGTLSGLTYTTGAIYADCSIVGVYRVAGVGGFGTNRRVGGFGTLGRIGEIE